MNTYALITVNIIIFIIIIIIINIIIIIIMFSIIIIIITIIIIIIIIMFSIILKGKLRNAEERHLLHLKQVRTAYLLMLQQY
jgi:uncharacterized membrane protein